MESIEQEKRDVDYARHNDVLREASDIFAEKNAQRGDMWREFPPSDKIRELGERVRRIEKLYAILDNPEAQQDMQSVESALLGDALDLINYTVFFVRQIREGASG